MADDTKSTSDDEFPADAQWDDDMPNDKKKLSVFGERKRMAEAAQKDWFWHADLAFEYKESSQIPPELRNIEGGVLYWVLNFCRDILANVLGSMTASEPIPVWSGRGFTDETGGKAVSSVVDFTMNNKKTTNLKVINASCCGDMVSCGLGAALEYYDEDAIVHVGPKKVMFGDVCAERLNVRKLLFDPTYKLKDIKSPEWFIYIREVKLRKLLQKYGEKARKIKGHRVKAQESLIAGRQTKDYNESSSSATTQTLSDADNSASASAWTRVADVEEHYYLISELVEVVYKRSEVPQVPPSVVSAAPPDSSSPDQQSAPGQPQGTPSAPTQTENPDEDFTGWTPVDYGPKDILPEEKDDHHTVKRLRNRVRRARVCEDELLDDVELKFDMLPIALWLGEEVHGFHLPVGIMYHIRHPQDLINSLISSVGENALLTNNPWIKWEEGALSSTMKTRVENHGGGPGLKIETMPGMYDKVGRVDPPQIPTGILTLWQEIVKLIDRIAGRYDVQYGRPPYDMSGRGLIASQQAADLSSQVWLQGMIGGLEQIGMLRLRDVQVNYVYDMALRSTDEIGQAKVLHLKKTHQGMSVVTEDGQTLLADLSSAEFDLEIKVEPGAMDSPELKQKKGQILFEAGALTPQRLAEAYGDRNATQHVQEVEQRNQKLALGDAALKATQEDPELMTIIQNPQILKGMEQDAAAFKALKSDPSLLPFLNPATLHKLVADAIAHRNGTPSATPQPPAGAGVPA